MRRVRLEKAEDKIGNTEHPAANNFSAATRTTFRLLGLAHGTTPHMSPSLGEPFSDSEEDVGQRDGGWRTRLLLFH